MAKNKQIKDNSAMVIQMGPKSYALIKNDGSPASELSSVESMKINWGSGENIMPRSGRVLTATLG